ncbi:MAG: DUF6518 family protein [Marmoricola sp.]
MTTYDRPTDAPPALRDLRDLRDLLAVPVVAGLGLALLDLVAMTHLGYPWANLANSSAVWAVGAFVLGASLRTEPHLAASAGIVMMVVAVESYYVFAILGGLAGPDSLWSSGTRTWLVLGVVAGAVFGTAGAWTTGSSWWRHVLGAAVGGGVLIGEALHTGLNLEQASGPFHTDLVRSSGLLVLLGCLLVAGTARTPRVMVPAAIVTVPVALFSAMAFAAVGIAY